MLTTITVQCTGQNLHVDNKSVARSRKRQAMWDGEVQVVLCFVDDVGVWSLLGYPWPHGCHCSLGLMSQRARRSPGTVGSCA